MEHTIKQLRKCDNLNILVISQDVKFSSEVDNLFDSVKLLKITQSNDKALEFIKTINFDIIIVDTKDNNFDEFFNEVDKLKIKPVKIIVLDAKNEKDIIDAVNSNVYTILSKPFDIINLKLAMIMSLNQTTRSDKIKLGQGFYFDVYRDRVYNKASKVVELTKLELGLLKLIIENKGKVVNYDQIAKAVWKGKNMSIFTMRNVVNKIRTKTYYDIFNNASSQGYIIH